jgi:hypothetical protein
LSLQFAGVCTRQYCTIVHNSIMISSHDHAEYIDILDKFIIVAIMALITFYYPSHTDQRMSF